MIMFFIFLLLCHVCEFISVKRLRPKDFIVEGHVNHDLEFYEGRSRFFKATYENQSVCIKTYEKKYVDLIETLFAD